MTELLTMLFMLFTAITMLLFYLRLRDMDCNADEYTRLIRRDIVDHDSHINTAVSDCALQISEMEKNLTTEIACLATKNNEDIKRMGGKFEEWDLIEVEGKEFVIVKNYTNSNGDSMVSCMGSNGQTYNYYKGRLADAKFIRHIESPFDEREV